MITNYVVTTQIKTKIKTKIKMVTVYGPRDKGLCQEFYASLIKPLLEEIGIDPNTELIITLICVDGRGEDSDKNEFTPNYELIKQSCSTRDSILFIVNYDAAPRRQGIVSANVQKRLEAYIDKCGWTRAPLAVGLANHTHWASSVQKMYVKRYIEKCAEP